MRPRDYWRDARQRARCTAARSAAAAGAVHAPPGAPPAAGAVHGGQERRVRRTRRASPAPPPGGRATACHDGAVLLAELTATSAGRARDLRAQREDRRAWPRRLRRMEPGEVAIGVAYLSGELRQRQIGVGYRSLRDLPAPAPRGRRSTLTEVDAACEAIGAMAGPGSQAARRDALAALFARATEPEQRFLVALLTGELRQGAQEGVMVEAVARAAEVPRDAVRRACMLSGDLGATAAAALAGRRRGAARGRARRSAARSSRCSRRRATTSTRRWRKTGPAAVEYKLDGARLQVHRRGDEVRAFTRSLDDITARVPEVVEAVLALPARERRARRRGDRAASPTGARTRSRSPRAASAPGAPTRRRRSRRCSSTCCTSTARTSSTARAPSARRPSTRWCRRRAACRGR